VALCQQANTYIRNHARKLLWARKILRALADFMDETTEKRIAELENRVRLLTWWISRGWINTDYSEEKSAALFAEIQRQATAVSDEYKATD
jgi:hypothetical protein